MSRKVDIYQNWLEAKEKLVDRDDILEPIRKFTKLAAEDYNLLNHYDHKRFYDENQQRQISNLENECNIQYLGNGNNRITFGIGVLDNFPKLKIGGEDVYLAIKFFSSLGLNFYNVQQGDPWPMYTSNEELKNLNTTVSLIATQEVYAFEKHPQYEWSEKIPCLHGIICSNGIILLLQEDLTKGGSLEISRKDHTSMYINNTEYIFDMKGDYLKLDDKVKKYWDSKLIL